MRVPASLDTVMGDVAAQLLRRPGQTSPDQSPGAAASSYDVDPDLVDDDDYAARPTHPTNRRAAGRAPEQTEGELTGEVLTWLNAQPGTFARKVHPDIFGGKGEPDIDGCTHSRTFKIELKVGRNKPSRAQETALQAWQRAGATVGWARTLDEVRAIHARIGDPTYRYEGTPGALPAPRPEER